MNNDLISREALKHKFAQITYVRFTADMGQGGFEMFSEKEIEDIIDKAPTVEEITNEDIQQAIKEGFANGYEMAKEKIIHSIAKQYSEHNELVPMWLSIGDIKDGAK